jgi:hypothetical protein
MCWGIQLRDSFIAPCNDIETDCLLFYYTVTAGVLKQWLRFANIVGPFCRSYSALCASRRSITVFTKGRHGVYPEPDKSSSDIRCSDYGEYCRTVR